MNFIIFSSEKLLIKVAKDGSACYFKIKPEYKDKPISENEFLQLLSKANVVHGFENAKKSRVITDDEFIPIALADNSINYPEINFNYDISSINDPQIDNLSDMPFVEKNTIIATISIKNKKNLSLNIFGKPNVEKNTVEVDTDENFEIISDTLISKEKGYIYKDNTGKIRLLTHLYEHNDVFRKSLNLQIKATFEKDILDSEIFSSEDITVLGGIRDCNIIHSQKNIIANTIDGSYLLAKESIIFSKQVTDSQLTAAKIIKGETNSKILSGNLTAGNFITLYDVLQNRNTSLEISLAPYEKELLKIIRTSRKTENIRKIKTVIEKEFYNFGYGNNSHYIQITNKLKPNVYIRIFDKSYRNKKEQINFSFK